MESMVGEKGYLCLMRAKTKASCSHRRCMVRPCLKYSIMPLTKSSVIVASFSRRGPSYNASTTVFSTSCLLSISACYQNFNIYSIRRQNRACRSSACVLKCYLRRLDGLFESEPVPCGLARLEHTTTIQVSRL